MLPLRSSTGRAGRTASAKPPSAPASANAIKINNMKSGKLLRITDDRSIYIHQNEDGSYIDDKAIIHYRNIGASFEIAEEIKKVEKIKEYFPSENTIKIYVGTRSC